MRGCENVIRGYDHPSAESLVLALLVEPLQRRLVRDAVGLDLGAPHNLVVSVFFRDISAQPANIIDDLYFPFVNVHRYKGPVTGLG